MLLIMYIMFFPLRFALEPQKHRVSFSNLSNTNEEEGLEDEENEDGDQDKEDESGAEESSEEEDEDNSDDEDEEVSDNFSDLASDENEEDDDEEHGSGERLKGSDKKVSSSGNKEATIKPILKKHEVLPDCVSVLVSLFYSFFSGAFNRNLLRSVHCLFDSRL